VNNQDTSYFQNSCIVLTGATSGIGKAMVDILISIPDTELILIGRDKGRCQQLEYETKDVHISKIKVICENLNNPKSTENIRKQIPDSEKRLILINNAGVGMYGEFFNVDAEVLHEILAVNINALVMLTHSVIPTIIKNGGGVLNISSVASFAPCPGIGVYGASKTFVTAFSEAIRAEFREYGINVVCYHPAGTVSNWFKRATGGVVKTPPVQQVRAETVALEALSSLARNQTNPINGLFNVFASQILGIMPRDLAAKLVYRRTKKVLLQI